MEKFPSFENKQESPNRLVKIADTQGEELDALVEKKGYGRFEKWRNKLNIAVLYGSLTLTAVVAAGCGGKKAEEAAAREGASRFPKAEEVDKRVFERRKIRDEVRVREEKETAMTRRRALEIAAKHGVDISGTTGGRKFNLEMRDIAGVPIIIDVNGQKIEVKREDLTEKELDTLKNWAWNFSEKYDQKPDNDAPPEMQAADKEINKNRRADRAILERLGVTGIPGSKPNQVRIGPDFDSKPNKIRESPDFESQPKIKGSKEVDIP